MNTENSTLCLIAGLLLLGVATVFWAYVSWKDRYPLATFFSMDSDDKYGALTIVSFFFIGLSAFFIYFAADAKYPNARFGVLCGAIALFEVAVPHIGYAIGRYYDKFSKQP